MEKYKIVFSQEALSDIDAIIEYIASLYTFSEGIKFGNKLRNRIGSLQNSAGSYAVSDMKDILKYHPQAKHICSNNGKWTIIFHTENLICFIDKIILSSRIKE